jgi:hypothetical protein
LVCVSRRRETSFYIFYDPIISISTKECTCQVSFSLSNSYVIYKYLGPPLTSKSSCICHKLRKLIYLFSSCLIYCMYSWIVDLINFLP